MRVIIKKYRAKQEIWLLPLKNLHHIVSFILFVYAPLLFLLCTVYIRCLKPNDQKLPDHFDTPRVLHQIKYLGLLDNVKVRRAGFAYRYIFSFFTCEQLTISCGLLLLSCY